MKRDTELNQHLGQALHNAAGRPPARQIAAVVAKGLHVGIEPQNTIAWLRRQRFAPAEVRDLASNRPRMRTLIRDVRRHAATSHDARAVAEKAAAWLLIEKPITLTDEQHRLALTAVAAIARQTTGPPVEGIGDGAFIPDGELGLALGLTRQGAAHRLRLASDLGAFDLRYRAKTGKTSKLRIKNAPVEWWQEAMALPGPAALADALEAGDPSVLDAILHPALGYGDGHLQQGDALLLMFDECGVDPRTRGFNAPMLSRCRARLRAAGVTDTHSMLAVLDELFDIPGADGLTPRARFEAVQAARREQIDRRTAENAELRDAQCAAAKVDRTFGVAFEAAGRVRPLVLKVLADLGEPGDRARDDLRDWAQQAQRLLAPQLSTDVERAAAASVLAAHVKGAGRTESQNRRLAEIIVQPSLTES